MMSFDQQIRVVPQIKDNTSCQLSMKSFPLYRISKQKLTDTEGGEQQCRRIEFVVSSWIELERKCYVS